MSEERLNLRSDFDWRAVPLSEFPQLLVHIGLLLQTQQDLLSVLAEAVLVLQKRPDDSSDPEAPSSLDDQFDLDFDSAMFPSETLN